ncbi:hypothetical protein ACTA71_002243 [Dictyostelium dimigraforme]
MKFLFSIIFLIFSINSVFSKNETIVLTPYKDSKCTQVGGGIGYGYMPELTSKNSNLIEVFGNYYDLLEFSESSTSKSDQLKMTVIGSNGKPFTTEIFDFNSCQYSKYLNGYYYVETNAELPQSSLQFNVWSQAGSFGDPCSVDNYQNFCFVTNGTTVSYDGQVQEFTCEDETPYITICDNKSNSCKSNHLTTCFDGQYRATCIN